MKMKTNSPIFTFLIILLFSSCANIKHITNNNASNVKGFRSNIEAQKKLDREVAILTKDESSRCQFVMKEKAKDNPLDSGKDYAIYYAKDKAYQLKKNAIVIEEIKKVGDYGHEVYFQIFHCPK
jgi:hypothetical protein